MERFPFIAAKQLSSSVSSSREVRDTEHFLEKTLLKANIEQAYALVLNEEKVLQLDDVLLQQQMDSLSRLCYDAEDMVSEIEIKIRASRPNMFAWLNPKKDAAVTLLKRRLLSLSTSLESSVNNLQGLLQRRQFQTPSMRHYKKHSHRSQRDTLVGRDGDMMDIIQELISEDKSMSSGVSIVGMNGVGKSSLANGILNTIADKFFDIKLWVSISGPFNPKEIGKHLLDFYNESSDGAGNNYTSIYQLLENRNYSWLIVLDNLLDVTYTEWSDFQSLFYPSSKGKFLITTANHNISIVTQTTRYHLHPLSHRYCREVILNKMNTELKDGKSLSAKIDILAKKCGGLPLAATFIGSQLHDKDRWGTMLNRDLWEIPEFDREILPTLASMYSMLKPHNLRKCFAYFSLFPRGYLFNMEDLIHLWIGEGLIQWREESSFEQVGKNYFETLVRCSILEPSSVDCNEKPSYFKIHEYMHKLAKLVASYTCFLIDKEAAYYGDLPIKPRHLSLSFKGLEKIDLNFIRKITCLRTLLPLGTTKISSFPENFFEKLLYIRVLSFKHTDVIQIPESIGRLKLLRYLDISDTQISRLPEAVSTLHSLIILKLRNTKSLLRLPKNFTKLDNLQYIDWEIGDMRSLKSFPSSIGNLTSLQRLPLFEVGEKKGYSITELRYMVHLRGSICITNLEKIKNKEEAVTANLSSKRSIEAIEFEWSSNLEDDISEDVLTALRPNASLRNLQLTNYSGREFPEWLSESHLLETINLRGCRSLPALGHLRGLKFLRIEDIENLESLDDLFHKPFDVEESFPVLESLTLKQLPKLISLPSLEHLTSLIDLQIIDCVALHSLPKLPSSLVSCDTPGIRSNLLMEEGNPSTSGWSMIDQIPEQGIEGKYNTSTSGDRNIQIIDYATLHSLPKLPSSLVSSDTTGFGSNLLMEEGNPSTSGWSMIDQIPQGIEGKHNPSTSDDRSIQIIDYAAFHSLPKLPSSHVSSVTTGFGSNLLMEEGNPSTSGWSMIDQIPKQGIEGKHNPSTFGDRNIQVAEESKKSSRWVIIRGAFTLSLPVKATLMEAKVISLFPNSDPKTCKELFTAFPCYLEMMLHCLLFPKGYRFGKERLIHLWSAAGFLKNEPRLEDIHRFFNFLLENKFISKITDDDDDDDDELIGPEVEEMYQFNSREFGSFFSKLETVKHFDEKIPNASVVATSFKGYWDVSVTSSEIDQEALYLLGELGSLRSLLFLNGSFITKLPSNIFSALNSLRTLDLSYTHIKEIPNSVHYVKDLRYLDLSWTLIERLPDSIVDLSALQDLKLQGCAHLFSLPKRMNQLIELRHLDFDILGQLTSMPEGIGALTELRTLWAFIVDNADGCNNIGELKAMKHLTGKICISGLENVLTLEEAKEATLIDKQFIYQLELRWSSMLEKIKGCDYAQVLDGLEPNTSLQDLQIICFPGSEFPKWVGDPSYDNLVSIMLYNCEYCEHLPALGGLPNLEKLEIIEVNGVRTIDDKIPFSKLQTLTIDGMQSLEEWSGLNGDILPCVDTLVIKNCPNWSTVRSSDPRLPSLLQLEIVKCTMLKSLPGGLLSTSLKSLIIDDCPFGTRYQDGGEERNKVSNDTKVWVFSDDQMGDEDTQTSISGDIHEHGDDMLINNNNGYTPEENGS